LVTLMPRQARRTATLAALCLSLALFSTKARAEPLSTKHTDNYYWLHGGLIAGGALATGAVSLIAGDPGPGWDLKPFRPDLLVRRNFSESASGTSDMLLALTASTTLFAQASDGFTIEFGNAALIYGEAMMANIFVTSLAKNIVRRPRPYTHAKDERVQEFAKRRGSDAYASFFSGHSSISATAATSGSLLYAMRTDDLVARHVMWGFELGLAGITAQLRVRAGQHYRTDIWLGTAVGLTIGFGVPALHRVELGRLRATEIVTGAGALVLAHATGELFDLYDRSRAEADGSQKTATDSSGATWFVLPLALPSGGGAVISGSF
jgi:membrane-associated phospholipid phosphatase